MKRTFDSIAFWKKADIIFQVVAFMISVFFIVKDGCQLDSLYSFYILGLAQFFSGVIWMFYFRIVDVPTVNRAKENRIMVVLVVLTNVLFLVSNIWLFFLFNLVMLVLGPIICISYFLQTIKEQQYYSKARKPYYLI